MLLRELERQQRTCSLSSGPAISKRSGTRKRRSPHPGSESFVCDQSLEEIAKQMAQIKKEALVKVCESVWINSRGNDTSTTPPYFSERQASHCGSRYRSTTEYWFSVSFLV